MIPGTISIGAVIADRLKLRQRVQRVALGVQRQRRGMLRYPCRFACRASSSWIRPESGSTSRHSSFVPAVQNTRPLVTVCPQTRQISDVIEVRVGQDDGVDLTRRNREFGPVAEAQLLQPLKQTAVDEDALPAVLEQIFRPGDRAGGTEKRQVSHSIDDDIRLAGARSQGRC